MTARGRGAGSARSRSPHGDSGGTVAFSARLPRQTSDRLKAYARQNRVSTSAAAAQLLEEGLRMARFPGIDFRWTPTGRKPHLTGSGLSVWELYHVWTAHRERIETVLEHYAHLTAAGVHAGIAYAKAHIHEMPEGEWGVKPAFAREVKT